MAKVAAPAPSASYELVSSTSARPSTPDVLRAWCRSLAGRQPLSLGEAKGRVAGSALRAQQLGGLHGHDTNWHRTTVAIRCMERNMNATSLRGCFMAAAWCGTFQWFLVLLSVAVGRPRASASCPLCWSNRSSGCCLEACPRWCSDKLNAGVWLLVLTWHVAVAQHRHGRPSDTAVLILPAACGSA